MAKVDSTRDYYADLEVPKGADVVEVKKQFKKLALKYHPDRNPGREEEFSPKFQAIQAAHEVLSDPAQRAKYDADRAKLGFRYGATAPRPATSGMPSKNPYAAYSNFPPPPRPPPTRPTTQPDRAGAGAASSGAANRYSRFARSFEPTGSKAAEANKRTNAFKAWESMKAAQSSANKANAAKYSVPHPPPPPRAAGPVPPPPPPRPRPTSEYFPDVRAHETGREDLPRMHRSNTTRTPKKSGFAPSTPGGDEPAAPNASSYFNLNGANRPTAPRFQTSTASVPPPRGAAVSDEVPPVRSEARYHEAARPDSARLRTPYSGAGGERTSIYGAGAMLGRSATTREPSKQHTPDRHRSASPPRSGRTFARPFAPGTGARTGPSSPSGSPPKAAYPPTPSAAPPPQPRGRPREHQARFEDPGASDTSSDGHTSSMGSSPTTAERMAAEGRARARRKGCTRMYPSYQPMLHRSSPEEARDPTGINVNEGPPRQTQRQRHSENAMESPKIQDQAGDKKGSSTTYAPFFSRSSTPSSGDELPPPARDSRPDRSGSPHHPHHESPFAHVLPSARKKLKYLFDWRPEKYIADIFSNSSFAFPVNEDTFAPTSPPVAEAATESPSRDINTNFSRNDWDGEFSGNDAAGYFAPPPTARSKAQPKSRVSPTRGRTTHKAQPEIQLNGAPHMPPPPRPTSSESPGKEPFSAEYWKQTLKGHSWEPPPHAHHLSGRRSESKLKGSRPRGISKATAKRSHVAVPKPLRVPEATDSSSEDESIPSRETFAEASPLRGSSREHSAMDIDSSSPAPPVQPDSKAGGSGGIPIPAPNTPRMQAETLSTSASGSASTPTSASVSSTQAPPLSSSSLDDGKINLQELRNVAPFHAVQEGLRNMTDMSSSLPFESRASTQHPTKSHAAQKLELPATPRAPPPPAVVNQATWDLYLAPMQVYLYEWSQFVDKMVAHWTSRQREVKQLGPHWLGSIGEGERGGFLTYMQGLEEDVRVRQHWNTAWEKHMNYMKAFGAVRTTAIENALRSA
ncbi:MAG: hypothetical protein M1825_002516 [Sarcosagium campestre]|nr:MAG: hypothetical protein M1825_002516 [Sarcosagium campestre]